MAFLKPTNTSGLIACTLSPSYKIFSQKSPDNGAVNCTGFFKQELHFYTLPPLLNVPHPGSEKNRACVFITHARLNPKSDIRNLKSKLIAHAQSVQIGLAVIQAAL